MGFSRQEYWNGLPLPSLTQVDTAIYVGMGTDRNNGDSIVHVCVYKENAGTDGLYIYISMMCRQFMHVHKNNGDVDSLSGKFSCSVVSDSL